MNKSRIIMYSMAFVLLAVAAYAGYLAGMFDWKPQTVFYVCGGMALLMLLVLSSHRMGGQVSTSFIFTRAFLGILAMGVSLFYSWNFVVGGAVGMAVATAAAFVLVTEGAKILFTSDIAYYSATGQGEKTVWTGAAVLVLFCLSIGATAWNLAVGSSKETAAAIQSDNRYTALQTRLDTVRTELQAARQDKANCPPNYFKNCINPTQARIDGLVAQEKTALTDLESFKPVAGGHVFWERLAEMTGYAAVTLQSIFDFLRGLLLEIIGLVLLAQASAAARVFRNSGAGDITVTELINNYQTAQDTLGRLGSMGLQPALAGYGAANNALPPPQQPQRTAPQEPQRHEPVPTETAQPTDTGKSEVPPAKAETAPPTPTETAPPEKQDKPLTQPQATTEPKAGTMDGTWGGIWETMGLMDNDGKSRVSFNYSSPPSTPYPVDSDPEKRVKYQGGAINFNNAVGDSAPPAATCTALSLQTGDIWDDMFRQAAEKNRSPLFVDSYGNASEKLLNGIHLNDREDQNGDVSINLGLAEATEPPIDTRNTKKAVGQTYQCVVCDSDYRARTVWQKYCPDCGGAKRSKYAMRRRKG